VLTPFDLERGPLLRATLVRLGDEGDRLVLTLHHIVTDGWSMDLVRDELAALYDAGVRGQPATLPPLAVQYGDHAAWERAWLQGEALDAELGWWRGALAGAPAVIALPADRPRPAAQSYRGDTRRVRFSPALSAALRRMGSQASATPFMTLLAGFKALLHRWGAGDDLVVGTHVANRDRVEVERLVGCFVNALVLRTDLSGDPTFAELLGRVRDTSLGAFAHAHLPFERLVEELQPERDLRLSPLYQVSFDFLRVVPDTGAGPGLLSQSPTAKFDLEVTALEVEDEFELHVSFSTDLFDASTVERMLRHLETLLAAAAADPKRRLSALPLLDAAERARLSGPLQGARRAYPGGTLGGLIAARAALAPHAVAAVHGSDRVTHAELDARSNRIARLLRNLGVARGERVGVLEERGIDFLAAVVGILKAGGAYVPFDPTYPAERIRHMLADSGVRVLITRAATATEAAAALAAAPALAVAVCLDEPADPAFLAAAAPAVRVIGRGEVDALGDAPVEGRETHPRDPAYVLYTSGSTGQPKGAAVRHDGAVNHVLAEAEVLGLDEGLVFLQSAPASSDISVWQMLAPLVLGGRAVIVDADTVADPERLLAVLQGEEITLFEPVPAVLRGVLEHALSLPGGARALPALRQVMVTGETVPVDLVNDWLAAYPSTVVVNAYGPTEASDDVTQAEVAAPLAEGAASVSIGRPIPNLECWVVDGALGLVPVGVAGELCIGGVAVGDGYPGHPAKTAAAFVPDPFGAAPGGVLYRTGDRVRWLADGTLDFVGRIDQQLKVRGFRIEPGEIEAVLRTHPAVADCAVAVRARGGEPELAAWIAGEADAAELREHLRGRLPEHMVPAVFVRVDALPLTPAGKVDRRALADDDREGMAAARPHVAPGTPTEEALAAIWAEVLRQERVSVDADFFELGGHSLLAAMVAARVRRTLEVELPLRRVFEHTTVARLAAYLDGARGDAPGRPLPRLERAARSQRRVGELADGILKTL
jgi:amino acid adenylation domain-containing protein